MQRFLCVCAGSAVGGGLRYLLSTWALAKLGPSFPWGTLAVNLIGSFLLSVLMHVGVEAAALSLDLRLTLTAGVMGGFTTYSSFSYETMRYLEEGALGKAAAYVAAMVAGCLAASALGWAAARALASG